MCRFLYIEKKKTRQLQLAGCAYGTAYNGVKQYH